METVTSREKRSVGHILRDDRLVTEIIKGRWSGNDPKRRRRMMMLYDKRRTMMLYDIGKTMMLDDITRTMMLDDVRR